MKTLNIFWFRHDLRLDDNHGLYVALGKGNVLPIFIFDPAILNRLEDRADRRVNFIHARLQLIGQKLEQLGSGLVVFHGSPREVFSQLVVNHKLDAVYANEDYEPFALNRDSDIRQQLAGAGVGFHLHKDSVIRAGSEVLTGQKTPYTVFTPYSRRWRELLEPQDLLAFDCQQRQDGFWKSDHSSSMPELNELGFTQADHPEIEISPETYQPAGYANRRDDLALDATSRLGIHLRFGTVSIRAVAKHAQKFDDTWLNQLIWRDFFKQVLVHYPHVVNQSYREKYAEVPWRNDPEGFRAWCEGRTGYPIVDAGMRELNQTGFMHNRARMITASFLCKHLLIDWRWGERYFAARLLDYDLSANNGNWQWAAGTGCDAVPYFRIFNPYRQTERYDPQQHYIDRWLPQRHLANYPAPIIDHKYARERTLAAFKGLSA